MLHITINGGEFFDDDNQEFIIVNPQNLVMEHSLLSLSKWEAIWKKPFLSDEEKSLNEYLDYIRCMTITSKVNPLLYKCLSRQNVLDIKEYINDTHTATTIKGKYSINRLKRSRIVTSEVIYYWMIANNIPIECEKWHLNRLLTLIQVCNIENNPKKNKMSTQDIYRQNQELNALRRAKYHTKG